MNKQLTISILALPFLLLASGDAKAAATQAPVFLAEIESFKLSPGCSDDFCTATLIVAGETIILPQNLLIDLPANRLTAKQIFDQAPAECVARGESGLAASDACSGGRGGLVTLAANRTRCGQVIAGDVYIQKGITALSGDVTYINYDEGWFRIDGAKGDPTQGTMVRFNDPSGGQSIQTGPGCAGGPNCSADPRFTNDPLNYTLSFLSGYPLCIPSTVVPVNDGGGFTTARRAGADRATGAGDPFCPATNRPNTVIDPISADSTRFAPLKVGDNVFVNGNFEIIGNVRFLSAHAVTVNIGLQTYDDITQPDFVQIIETVWDMPNFGRDRARFRALGQGTLPGSGPPGNAGNDLDVYAVRVSPIEGKNLYDPLASTFNNPGTKGLGSRPTGINIWRIDYDVTFPPLGAKPNQPCTNLLNGGLLIGAAAEKCAQGGTMLENFAVLSPVSREVMARTRHKTDAMVWAAAGGPPVPVVLDLLGNPATQGEYTRPLGISLGGLEPPAAVESDLNLASQPFVFEGLPWMLDRRVGPSGCSVTGCEPLATFPAGTFAANAFPFSGRDPNAVVSTLVGALTSVPVLGRPMTYFTQSPTGSLQTAVLPVPGDNQCPAGTVVRSFSGGVQ
ncbi:MAG: hypothetical protein JWO86_8816 [Myxococcaceae bacterium]|nr:hypothetical protein [Myxococcaceae bacterium]MEA2751236.1 hypothetical protein [Myxococcales bacterium]